MLFRKLVLAFALHEVLGGVDEEHVVGLVAFFEHEDADPDAGGVEAVGGQADDRVDVASASMFVENSLSPSAIFWMMVQSLALRLFLYQAGHRVRDKRLMASNRAENRMENSVKFLDFYGLCAAAAP